MSGPQRDAIYRLIAPDIESIKLYRIINAWNARSEWNVPSYVNSLAFGR